MKSYIHRLAEPLFSQTAEIMRIVLVSGPRQCGKTTLLKAMLTKDDLFLTFDDDETLRSAIADPNAFLRFYSQKYKRIALDEIQKAPVLLGALKKTADEDPRPGRFLISGSSNYQALPGAVESLAGRLGEVRLRTMSAREMAGNCSVDLIDRLCQKISVRCFTRRRIVVSPLCFPRRSKAAIRASSANSRNLAPSGFETTFPDSSRKISRTSARLKKRHHAAHTGLSLFELQSNT